MKNRVGKLNKKITMIGGWVELYLKKGCVLEGGVNERKMFVFGGIQNWSLKLRRKKARKWRTPTWRCWQNAVSQ